MLNLLYHDIGNPSLSGFQNKSAFPYKIPTSIFEDHLKIINDSNVKCLCTFDDGGASALKAAELLEKYRKSPEFFISTKFINTKTFLSKSNIRELVAMGFEVGLHTYSHPKCLNDLSFNQQFEEWYTNKEILEDILESNINSAAMPGGFYNSDTFQILSELSVPDAFHSFPFAINSKNMHALSTVSQEDDKS